MHSPPPTPPPPNKKKRLTPNRTDDVYIGPFVFSPDAGQDQTQTRGTKREREREKGSMEEWFREGRKKMNSEEPNTRKRKRGCGANHNLITGLVKRQADHKTPERSNERTSWVKYVYQA